jgi:hypothetical protein
MFRMGFEAIRKKTLHGLTAQLVRSQNTGIGSSIGTCHAVFMPTSMLIHYYSAIYSQFV